MRLQYRVCSVIMSMLLVLSGCTGKTKPTNQDPDSYALGVSQQFEFALKLGDAAVAYFLGKEYDQTYSFPLSEVSPYIQTELSDNVQLTPEACETIEAVYNNVLQMAVGLPKEGEVIQANPWDGMTYTQMAKGYVEGILDLPEDVLDILVMYGYLTSDLKLYPGMDVGSPGMGAEQKVEEGVVVEGEEQTEDSLKSVFFPTGTAPNIDVTLAEFRTWFIDTAKTAGLLDKRVFETNKGIWWVAADNLLPEDGGKELRLFDKMFTITDDAILKTSYALKNLPIYTVVLDTYRYYDTGSYTAEYVTDESLATDSILRVRVTFNYYPTTRTDIDNALDLYLAGVTDLSVIILD